eukprot:GHVL01010283.1.p1 GENE.GHVL01010283.1~~GHVL01010283.1.p1  ORF type:complete len:530 (+),score=101.44 GHVL01010283.1:36-1625(+)
MFTLEKFEKLVNKSQNQFIFFTVITSIVMFYGIMTSKIRYYFFKSSKAQSIIKFIEFEHENDANNDDVEDLQPPPKQNNLYINSVKIKQNEKIFESDRCRDSKLPGTQNIYFRTYGCSHNSSDSEFMMGLLSEYGYQFVDKIEDSDICIINSCTVKNPSQDAFTNLVDRAKMLKKNVVVSGCVPQGDRNLPSLDGVSIVGVTQIDRIVEVVELALTGNTVRLLSKKELPSLDMPKIRRNKIVEIIPLSTGCLGCCTYCKTKHARGNLGSYEPSAIYKRIERAVIEGVKQIWLTSEDTGAYGIDLRTNIADLLEGIVERLPQGIMLRIGMTNPPYILRHIDRVAKILQHPQVFEFLHIPVQSGSNSTLSRMVREYTVEDFNKLVYGMKNRVPNLTVATDIICAFPCETDEEHQQTLDLISSHRFPIINISQFYARSGTPAASYKRTPNKIGKKRSNEVSELFRSYESFQWLVYKEVDVWFSDVSDKSDHTIGHTKEYIKVLVKHDDDLIGRKYKVKILNASKWHVDGIIV